MHNGRVLNLKTTLPSIPNTHKASSATYMRPIPELPQIHPQLPLLRLEIIKEINFSAEIFT